MPTIADELAWGIEQHQAGRLEAAEAAYQRILAADPDHAHAGHLLGVLCSQRGRHDRAVEYISSALAKIPDWPEAHYNLGNAWRGLKRLDDAIGCYRRALELKPNYVEALVNLGNSWKDQRQFDEAIACYRRALQLQPDLAVVHSNLGNVLQEQNELEAAVSCYRTALQLEPDWADAHNNLGRLLQRQGKVDEAIASCRRALELQPDSAAALTNLGNALQEQGQLDDAVDCYGRALAVQPELVAAHKNLGVALTTLGRLNEAIASCRRAAALDPEDSEVHYNLGNALQKLGLPGEAIACYQQVLQLRPEYPEAWNNLGSAWKDLGDVEPALACYRQALELRSDYPRAHSNFLYTLHYRTGITPTELLREHLTYQDRHGQSLCNVAAPSEPFPGGRPLRVGFVSPDLGTHPVGYFLVGVLEHVDRGRLQTVCYSDRRQQDEMTLRLKSAATDWRDTAGLPDERLTDLIREDRIDILFDLAGHSGYNRLPVFARKPAPIQMTWIGYEGTTGLDAIDYLLADRHVVPEGSECFHREQVLRMPDGYLCYEPPTAAPPVGPLPALCAGTVTFGSFNNLAKITHEVVSVWSDVLRTVPNSRLLMKYRGLADASARHRYLDVFAARGIGPERLEFHPYSSFADYLATYGQVDLVLDSFPFSGSTVTCEALWMGVPVVTCPGETFGSRHSLSHLSNIGLQETIARNYEEYVDLAVGLAGDLPRLAALRSGLREKMAASPLCDGKRFADNWTALLYDAWGRPRRQPAPEG
jgi:predicted O-linked N-acetylglucosamine transferase (SPINDLY family)